MDHAQMKRPKYGNRKVVKNGETWDSVREYERHLVLLDMQKRGEIRQLKRQVTFKLKLVGVLVGSVRPDWTYEARDLSPHCRMVWRKVAEDCKGYQTRDHKTRWKLAKALYPDYIWRLS
jgi:hypothetical protein